MQRRAPPSSPVSRRGRRQQLAPRLRVLSGWELVFVASLFVATVFNLYTYSGRREQFLRAHGKAGDNPPDPVHPNDTLGVPPRSARQIDIHNNINTNTHDNNRIPTKVGGKRPTPNTDASAGDGNPNVRKPSSSAQHHPPDSAPVSAIKANSAAGANLDSGARSGGGTKDVTAVGAGGTWEKAPAPSLRVPAPPALTPPQAPLGRIRPLQIATRLPTAAGSEYDLRWPEGGESGGGGNGDKVLWPSEATPAGAGVIVHFPCSLTEVDDVPGLAGRYGGRTAPNRMTSWSTSGPCVISCSTPQGEGEEQGTGDAVTSSLAVADGGGGGASPSCAKALRACELYQECTHILLPPTSSVDGGGEDRGSVVGDLGAAAGSDIEARTDDNSGGGRFATLMHLPVKDGSLVGVETAAAVRDDGVGWGAGGFTLETGKQRTYYVVSFGGSGSKMLGGWLSERGKSLVKEVFHIHDPRPADKLFAKVARRGVSAGREGRGKDFRGYDFPEGDFPADGKLVEDVDSYRVVMIFKDPAEALISRYFYNHCKNLRGAECGATPQDFPSLESYAEESGDRLHMETFYDNYCDPTNARRNYPVVCVNYHKMWDNKEALVKALGLPPEEALKMPKRTETVRNDHTSAERGEPFTLAVRERLRRKHASLSRKVFESPAVAVV